jgi:alkanesulfonate monooxygenase SsuD/methylene tetrahydromethanopterin reductase-like flavin-dependent oxidoreductase (luciferase family)
VGEEEFHRQRHGYAHGMGGLIMVGDPDRIADTLASLSRAGLRGIGFSFVNYLKELPFFAAEVLPRLERMGIRAKRRA